MADLSYTVDINTTPAQRNLDNLNKKIDTVNSAFGKMRAAVAGLAIGGFIAQTFQFADAIQDISDATNIGTDAILGFSKAVALSGGNAEKAQQGILKFVQSIGEAAEGSLKTQNAFEDVGVSLRDLQTLSEKQLLEKAINGLGQITDAGKRSTLQMELFGKAMKGVSAQGLAQAFGVATVESAKYAGAIKAAADTQQNFENVLSTLKIELLAALKPISELASGLLEAGSKAKEFIRSILDIAMVIGTFFLVTKAIRLVVFALEALIAAPALLMRGWGALVKTWEAFTFQMGKVVSGGGVTAETLAGLQKRFHWLGVAINEIGKGLGILAAGFVAFYKMIVPDAAQQKLEEFFGKLKEWTGFSAGAGAGRGGNDELTKQLQQQGEEMRKQAEAAREVQDALAKRRKEIEQTSVAFQKQNADVLQAIGLEKQFVGKSAEEVEIIRAQEEVYKRAADEAEKLRLVKSMLTKDEQKLAPIYDAQIAKIQQTAETDAARIKSSLEGLQGLKLLEQDRLNRIELMTQALEKQKSLDESMLKIRQQTQGELDTAGFEQQQMGRSPLEKQFASIQENARKAALEAGRAFSEQFNAEDMGAEDAKKLADGLELIAQRYKQIADIQSANLTQSRSFAQGWKEAFDEYMDSATNAAKRAGEVFSSVTGNMNSAIDKFVETGKFSFSDFARSVIQDLIKIELKAQATQLLKGALSAGGSFLGSLFGFAEGGNPPVNKPSIVGEKGPELFVPRTAGTVIPNNQLGMGGSQQTVNNNTVYNISAIDARSVAEFFAANRKTMLGSIQMAQKELPYGNR
jgi:lambda family phage tail tape measure protein